MTDDSAPGTSASGDGRRSRPVRADGGRNDDDDDRYEHAPAVEYDAEGETAETGEATPTDGRERGERGETAGRESPAEPNGDAAASDDRAAAATADEGAVATAAGERPLAAADLEPSRDRTPREVAVGIAAVYGAVTAGLALAALALSGFDLRALTAFGTGFGFVSAEATMHAVAPTAVVLAALAGGYAARELPDDDRDATVAAVGGTVAGSVVLAVAVALAVWLPAQGLDVGLAGLLGGAVGVGAGAAVAAALVVWVAGRFLDLSPSVRVVTVADENGDDPDAADRETTRPDTDR